MATANSETKSDLEVTEGSAGYETRTRFVICWLMQHEGCGGDWTTGSSLPIQSTGERRGHNNYTIAHQSFSGTILKNRSRSILRLFAPLSSSLDSAFIFVPAAHLFFLNLSLHLVPALMGVFFPLMCVLVGVCFRSNPCRACKPRGAHGPESVYQRSHR